MNNTINLLLLGYFVVYFAITFVFKSILVAKQINKNPLVLPTDDSAYALVGFYFKLTLLGLFIYLLVNAIFLQYRPTYANIYTLEKTTVKIIGCALLSFSFVWTLLAQKHMKNSWRIGIDTALKTELITTGLFRYSRNPVFFGMILSLAGLFLLTPNAFTALFLIIGYVLIQIQIRLEEEFLAKEHGTDYAAYKQSVRRLI